MLFIYVVWFKKVSSHSDGGEDVWVTSILDGHNANAVESTDSSAELNVVSFPVEDLGTTEDSQVFKFSLSDGGAVVGDNHELAGSVSKLLESKLVADLVLARLDGEIELLLKVVWNVGYLSHVDDT